MTKEASKAPSEEEFAQWKDHPVTQYVLEAYELMATAQREAWLEMSWDGGHADSFELCGMRSRADAYKSMGECNLADFIAAVEPEVE